MQLTRNMLAWSRIYNVQRDCDTGLPLEGVENKYYGKIENQWEKFAQKMTKRMSCDTEGSADGVE